jgi:hypothetical protein
LSIWKNLKAATTNDTKVHKGDRGVFLGYFVPLVVLAFGDLAECNEELESGARTWENKIHQLSVAAAFCAFEGGLYAGDKASITAQSVVSVPSFAYPVFACWCADLVRVAGLVFGSSSKVDSRDFQEREQERLSVSLHSSAMHACSRTMLNLSKNHQEIPLSSRSKFGIGLNLYQIDNVFHGLSFIWGRFARRCTARDHSSSECSRRFS